MPGIELLNSVWADIDKSDLFRKLKIEICGKTVTPKEQFEAYYRDAIILFDTPKDAETMFWMILAGNEGIVRQIIHKSEGLSKLTDLNVWCNVEDFVNSNTVNNLMNDTTKVETATDGTGAVNINNSDATGFKSKSGVTDASSYSEDENEKGLTIESGTNIPANSLTQMGTVTTGKVIGETTDKTNSKAVTKSEVESKTMNTALNIYKRKTSNAADDHRQLLNLELTDLTAKFWSKFSCMFYFNG